jgi:hypothetical protein
MSDPIIDDVQEQIDAFVARVRETFDVARYPGMTDSGRFDRACDATETAFERLKYVFNDYLVTRWAAEAAQMLGAAPRSVQRASEKERDSS